MSRKRLVSMVGGTITCALAIGFFMQRGDSAAPRNLVPAVPPLIQQTVLKPAVRMAPVSLDTGAAVAQPVMKNLVLDSSMAPVFTPPNLPEAAHRGTDPAKTSVDGAMLPTSPDASHSVCDVATTAIPREMAMVRLEVLAPCFRNERVTVHHNGMMFTTVTDEAGKFSADIPALSARAVFIVAFADGKGSVAVADVAALENFDRVVVQWTGRAGFQIHAREFGAGYGEAGHVWSGVARDPQNNGGFVTRLGNPDTLHPQMAEIYTFPSGMTSASGVVALSVETEVTQENCGRDISAQSLQLREKSSLHSRELVMAMPDCSDLGDFLVLNNLLDDLKIAAR